MRIQVQTSFTTVVSEKILGTTMQDLENQVERAMRTSSILNFKTEDGSMVTLSPQLLINSVVIILKD